jgi:ribosomal protein S18 acetylase RimI-like enzyme
VILAVTPATMDVFADAARHFTGRADDVGSFVSAAEDHEVQGWCGGHHPVRPDGSGMVYPHHREVASRFRGRGIGRALSRSFMGAGVERGAAKMFLVTGASNAAARHLHESMGGGPATQGPTVNYWFPPA